MKKIIITGMIICGVIFLTNCKTEKKESKPIKPTAQENTEDISNPKTHGILGCSKVLQKHKQNNLNISILLDLSDRIDDKKYPNPVMSYKERDLGYIKAVAKSFQDHVLSKKIMLMNDQIQVFVEPAPSKMSINQKLQALKITLNKQNVTKQKIDSIITRYDSLAKEIYDSAQKTSIFPGSDIWRFFKDKVKDLAMQDCNRNVLIIFTDGYIYHKDTKWREKKQTTYLTPQFLRAEHLNNSQWETYIKNKGYGFIQATNQLNDLEVLVIGIENHDKKNTFGYDVIIKYWENWLTSMGVKRLKIIGADLPANVGKVIEKFIET